MGRPSRKTVFDHIPSNAVSIDGDIYVKVHRCASWTFSCERCPALKGPNDIMVGQPHGLTILGVKLWHHRENGAGKHAIVPPRYIVIFCIRPFPPDFEIPRKQRHRGIPWYGRCANGGFGQFPWPRSVKPRPEFHAECIMDTYIYHMSSLIFSLRGAIRRTDILPKHLPITRVPISDLHLRCRGGKGDRSCGRHHSIRMRRTVHENPDRCADEMQ